MTAWTGTLPTPADGNVILGADIATLAAALHALTDAWTPYIPTWTAPSTNPSIGNGSLSAKYLQAGKLVIYTGQMLAGSSTTFGSGVWSMSLPVTPAGPDLYIGTAFVFDNSAGGGQTPAVTRMNLPIGIRFYGSVPSPANAGNITSTVPITWASADQLIWTVIYEAA